MEPYQSKILFESLKSAMKSRGFRYSDLAAKLDCSPSTIKHMFHGGDAPVSRVIEICNVIGVSFPDLVSIAGDYTTHFTLTQAQEQFLADNLGHYEFFRKVFFERLTPSEVKQEAALDDRSLRRYLSDLERLGILDVHAGDKLVFHVQGMQQFLPGGPLMRRYLKDFAAEIAEVIEGDMTSSEVFGQFGYFSLTAPAYREFLHDLGDLLTRYRRRAHREFVAEAHQRQTPVSWLLGVVPRRLQCFYNSRIPKL